MKHCVIPIALMLGSTLPAPAWAQGFTTRNLTGVSAELARALGKGVVVQGGGGKLTLSCPGCEGMPIIGFEVGRQNDGTEQRVRSGQTKIADLENQCRASSPECRIAELPAAPAVGWVSAWSIGDSSVATAILIHGGDLLTVRSIAEDPVNARAGIDKLMPVIRSRIIGE